jgi:hypothetical protein
MVSNGQRDKRAMKLTRESYLLDILKALKQSYDYGQQSVQVDQSGRGICDLGKNRLSVD